MYPLSIVLGTTVITTSLRFQLNSALCGAQLGVKRINIPGSVASKRATLVEESWLLAVSLVLMIATTRATMYHNGACNFVETQDCFLDWPNRQCSPQVRNVLALTLGWYVHGIIKSLVPGIGLRSGTDMIAHHFVSVLCLLAVSAVGIASFSILLLSVLNLSSPFMHLAKVIYYSGGSNTSRTVAFSIFALAFFISRLLMFPYLVYGNGIRAMNEYSERGSFIPGVLLLGLGTILEGLQVYWMWKIIRVLVSGKADSSSKAPSRMNSTASHPKSGDVASAAEGYDAVSPVHSQAQESVDHLTDSEGSSQQFLPGWDDLRHDSEFGTENTGFLADSAHEKDS